jgi:hypothetical protein
MEVMALVGEDLLLILCAHGAKHLWMALGWICDVAELLRVHRDMNWPDILEEARSRLSARRAGRGKPPPTILQRASSHEGKINHRDGRVWHTNHA